MVYVTYEAVRDGVPRTDVCDAKVWHKIDDSHEVMSNTCKWVVESVEGDATGTTTEDGAKGEGGGDDGKERLRLMGGFRALDHTSEEARSAAVEYARQALGMGGGHGHGGGHHHAHHAAEDSPGMEKIFLCAAQKQIVNGVNYELTLRRSVAAGGTGGGACDINARVYKSFDDVFEVKQLDHSPATEGA